MAEHFVVYKEYSTAACKAWGMGEQQSQLAHMLRSDPVALTGATGRGLRAIAAHGSEDYTVTQAMDSNVVVFGLQYGPDIDRTQVLRTFAFEQTPLSQI